MESNPGQYDEVACGICGDKMNSKFYKGVGGFAAAMAGHTKDHDRWTCPNSKLDWHVQAKKLKSQINEMASAYLADIMRLEMESILQSRKATK